MPFKKPNLIVIGGPTAVGKTSLAISLAKEYNTEVISADSRQCFKELNIGTAKPSLQEMDNVHHHFIDSVSIHEHISGGDYEKFALQTLEKLFQKHETVIMVGGTGLYIQAVCDGLDYFPAVPDKIRTGLMERAHQEGVEPLFKELQEKDPVYSQEVDPSNKQRIVRALEVCMASGKPFSSFRSHTKKDRSFNTLKIGLELDRPTLYQRINKRVDLMVQDGLFNEAEPLLEHKHINALKTVGYQEIWPFMEGQYSKERAIELIKRNSRRYAKKQLTWFKKDSEYHWFNPQQLPEIKNFIKQQLSI